MLSIVIILLGIALAVNVGGNNSAAEMGPAFGAGVRSRREAVALIAVFSMIGALVAGSRVVHTVAQGIVPGEILSAHTGAVAVIVLSATGVIGLANLLRIPVATSHAMVGAVVGMGLFYGHVKWPQVGVIVTWWLVTPVLSLVLSYLAGRYLYGWLQARLSRVRGQACLHGGYRWFLTISGCFMAFSAGSNSLAKAMGPIVGSGVLGMREAAVLGGLGMAAGALIMGHRLLHTVGKGITPIDPLKASMIELICGSIILASSLTGGIPVSLAEIVTCSVIGFSCAHSGLLSTARNKHVRKIYKLWPACPVTTAMASFSIASLVRMFIPV